MRFMGRFLAHFQRYCCASGNELLRRPLYSLALVSRQPHLSL